MCCRSAFFLGGAMAPLAGWLTDQYGGRAVMTVGSTVAGVALVLMSFVTGPYGLFFALLLAEVAAMCVLYNVAFAAVARLDLAVPTQRSISIITLFGGIASTIFWPLTLWLYTRYGWEASWVVLGITTLIISVSLHFYGLRGPLRDLDAPKEAAQSDWPELRGPARKRGMLWMVISFLFSGYLIGAVMTLWVTNVQDLGHSAALAAIAGAVIGPFKTVGRFFEMLLARNMYPLVTYILAMSLMMAGFMTLLVIGFTIPGIMLAAALYGMGDGIKTIARGTLPLALFGSRGYGARLGWISFLSMGVNASAPFVFAWLTQAFGGWWSFFVMTLCLSVAIATYALIPDPRWIQNDPTQDRCLPNGS
ncbi:MFS transporter [Yoonia sp. GPGPB17]|uniref:MFS transporter n=1 Tax=Yoonia sp. GPGPB17 TaxID=3026147 RepID=UPI0030BD57C8